VLRELLPNVGTARMLIVRLVIGSSLSVNVTEHVDTVSPTGLTILNVIEHGGHDIGTVGTIVTDTEGVVSSISRPPPPPQITLQQRHTSCYCNAGIIAVYSVARLSLVKVSESDLRK